MAAVLVLAGLAIKRKIDDKKRAKQLRIDLRYEELQRETSRRLSTQGNPQTGADGNGNGDSRSSSDDEGEAESPPPYERVVRAGVRRASAETGTQGSPPGYERQSNAAASQGGAVRRVSTAGSFAQRRSGLDAYAGRMG